MCRVSGSAQGVLWFRVRASGISGIRHGVGFRVRVQNAGQRLSQRERAALRVGRRALRDDPKMSKPYPAAPEL